MSEKLGNSKYVEYLIMEYENWLSRQQYWAKNGMQVATIILSISTISLSISNEKNMPIIIAFIAISVLTLILPSALIYSYLRKKSIKRLQAIEEDLDLFGVHLGYQRTFNNIQVPRYANDSPSEDV